MTYFREARRRPAWLAAGPLALFFCQRTAVSAEVFLRRDSVYLIRNFADYWSTERRCSLSFSISCSLALYMVIDLERTISYHRRASSPMRDSVFNPSGIVSRSVMDKKSLRSKLRESRLSHHDVEDDGDSLSFGVD